jgi:hypothetical protein
MVLLIRSGKLDKTAVRDVREAWDARGTRRARCTPRRVGRVFDALANECGLAMKLDGGFAVMREFARTFRDVAKGNVGRRQRICRQVLLIQ